MSEPFYKQDRVGRLLRELNLFHAVPHGLTTRELAERMGISQRSAQRDIAALEEELGVPFTQIGSRWRVIEGYWLAPLNFTVQEAVALLLSARLMLRFADRLNPWAVAAYEKVAAVLPAPIKAPLMETVAGLSSRRVDPAYTRTLAALITAWAEKRKIVISYAGERERTVWPLFLEPNASGHSCYMLAWDPGKKGVRAFRVERITTVGVTGDRFNPPLGFSVSEYLAHSWTIWGAGAPMDVELLFSSGVAERVIETVWHPSQRTEQLLDGRVRMELRVADPTEIIHWVLGWGAACEVVAPMSFRRRIAVEIEAMNELYSESLEPVHPFGITESVTFMRRRTTEAPRGGRAPAGSGTQR